MKMRILSGLLLLAAAGVSLPGATYDYRVLSTIRTSTMEKEMNEAAADGFVFSDVMGGQTAMGGKEVVVVMWKDPAAPPQKRAYKLLATSRTSTMQKEIQQFGDEGFEYRGQTVFQSGIAGAEVAIILEKDTTIATARIEYRLLATSRTSTMQKELQEAGTAGFRLLGLTVAKTSFAGAELVCVLKKD